MTTEYLGKTTIRKPEYTDPRWDVPLNVNWEGIATMLETLVSGFRWVDGLELTKNGLGYIIADGNIDRGNGPEPITGVTNGLGDGKTTYIFVNASNQIASGNSFDFVNIIPLYMLLTSGGVVTEVGDLRHLQVASGGGGGGGLTWEIKTTDFQAEDGKGYFVDVTGGAVTVTAPATPALNTKFGVKDHYNNVDSTNKIIVVTGAELIEGEASPVEITSRGYGGEFVYSDATRGWMIVNNTPMTEAVTP